MGNSDGQVGMAELRSDLRHFQSGLSILEAKHETLDLKVQEMDQRVLKVQMEIQQIAEGRKEFRAWALSIIGTIIGALVIALMNFSQ